MSTKNSESPEIEHGSLGMTVILNRTTAFAHNGNRAYESPVKRFIRFNRINGAYNNVLTTLQTFIF